MIEERWPMKVHRTLGRWSETAGLVPEWMWWGHMFLAAIAAVALTLKFELPFWLGVVAFAIGTILLTAGLFHRVTAFVVAALGSLVAIGAGAIVFGSMFGVLLRKLFGESELLLWGSLGLGALVGAWIALASYRPLLRRLREPPGSNG